MTRSGRGNREQQPGAVEIERSESRAGQPDAREAISGQSKGIGTAGAVFEPIVVVDHDQPAAGPQYARRLAQCAELRVVDTIEGATHLFPGRIKDVAAAVARVAERLLASR